jgi:hypothetical protein
MERLDLDHLRATSELEVVLPRRKRTVRIKRGQPGEYFALIPAPPAEAAEWPEAEALARETAWLRALPVAERFERVQAFTEAKCRWLATLCLEPAMTSADLALLGPDAQAIFEAALQFSSGAPEAPTLEDLRQRVAEAEAALVQAQDELSQAEKAEAAEPATV